MEISKFALPEIIHGRGSLNYAGQCALRLGAKKVFLVSASGIEEADRLMDDLGLAAIETLVAFGVAMEGGLLPFGDGAGICRILSEEIATGSGIGRSIGNGAANVGQAFGLLPHTM